MDTNTICGILNEYLFRKVWNQNYEDSKLSARLFRWIEKSVNGGIRTPTGTVYLPTLNEPYYVFMVNFTQLSYKDLNLTEAWTDLATINNASDYEIRIINRGHVLYGKEIYLCRYGATNDIFLVVSKKMFHAICGPNNERDASDNFIHKEKFTNILVRKETAFVSVKSIHIETIQDRVTALGYCNEVNTCILLNGEKQNSVTYEALVIGSYLEVINDTNIVVNYTLDLSVSKPTFISQDDNKLYVLCHTPKAQNPANHVLTSNLLEVYVFAKHSDNTLSDGLLLFSETLKLKHVTHNDFAIPNDLLVAYSQLIGSGEIVLNVQCKIYSNTHTLIRDKNYIDLLYKHSDSEILNFLNGIGLAVFSFWTSGVLSASNYVKYFNAFPTFVDSTNLDTFIDTFGYQQILAILTDRIRTFTYNETVQYPFVVQPPSSFIGDTLPVLYRNGIKVSYDDVVVSKLLDNYISIEVPLLNLVNGDKWIIELFEKTNLGVAEFTPLLSNHTIVMQSNHYDVYQREAIPSIKGVNETFEFGYTLSSDYVIIENGTNYSYLFDDTSYSKQYIFVPKSGIDVYIKDLEQSVFNVDPLYVTLDTAVIGQGFKIPLLGVNTTVVTLNGKELVSGVDYKLVEIKDGTKIVAYQVVIYNALYLTNNSNVVEIIADKSESYKTVNFFNSDVENFIPNVFNWFDTISTATCDGAQIYSASSDGTGLVVLDSHRSGALIGTRTIFSESTQQFIATYKSDEADSVYNSLVTYFIQRNPPYTGLVTIPYAHVLYSIKLCMIIRDLLNSSLELAYDPDPQRMLNQVADYNYLDAYDIINDSLDKRFIDYNPLYREIQVINPALYNIINHIGKTIIDDPITYTDGALT